MNQFSWGEMGRSARLGTRMEERAEGHGVNIQLSEAETNKVEGGLCLFVRTASM